MSAPAAGPAPVDLPRRDQRPSGPLDDAVGTPEAAGNATSRFAAKSTAYRRWLESSAFGARQCWADHAVADDARLQEGALTGRWRIKAAGRPTEWFHDGRAAEASWRQSGRSTTAMAGSAAAADLPPAVVLVHGLGRSRHCMQRLSADVAAAGMRPFVFGYPSRYWPIERSADCLHDFVGCIPGPTIHFVGHSLGGLLIRTLCHACPDARYRRGVFLGVPNTGSPVADFCHRPRAFRRLLGPALSQLCVGSTFLAGLPASPPLESAAIAGSTRLNLMGWTGMADANDLLVTAASAQLQGAQCFRVIHCAHSLLMSAAEGRALTVQFLRNGWF